MRKRAHGGENQGRASGWRRPAWVVWLCFVVVSAFAPPRCAAQVQPVPEYQLKAAYLCNFAEFISWPDSTFTNATSPLVIGVLGADPFGPYLDQAAKDKTAGTHPLAIRRGRQAADFSDCHVLFISNSEAPRLGEILKTLRERPVLTVGEAPPFLLEGGIIKLTTLEKKVRFEVNLDSAAAANLHFQARLLRLASAVQGDTQQKKTVPTQ